MAKQELALQRPTMTKRMRAYVRSETRTDRRSLEERRDRLQVRIGKMWEMAELLQSPTTPDADKAKVMNLISVYGVTGMLEGLAFLADCVSTRVIVKSKDAQGKKVKTPVRYSLAMTAEDIAGSTIDASSLTDSLVRIARDLVLMKLDPEKKAEWYDENGVLRCPHFREEEGSDDELTEDEEKAITKEDEERRHRIEEEEKSVVEKLRSQYIGTREQAQPNE